MTRYPSPAEALTSAFWTQGEREGHTTGQVLVYASLMADLEDAERAQRFRHISPGREPRMAAWLRRRRRNVRG